MKIIVPIFTYRYIEIKWLFVQSVQKFQLAKEERFENEKNSRMTRKKYGNMV